MNSYEKDVFFMLFACSCGIENVKKIEKKGERDGEMDNREIKS